MAYENSQAWFSWTEPWKGYVYPADALERPFDAVASTRAGGEGNFAPVLRISRPSWDYGRDFADSLIPSLLRQAKKSIAITQQDIISIVSFAKGLGTYTIWPYEILNAIAFAKLKNPDLEVRILTSVPWFSPDNDDLTNAFETADIYGYHPYFGPRGRVIEKLCDSYCTQKKGGYPLTGNPFSGNSYSDCELTFDECAGLFPVHYMYQQLRGVLDSTATRPDADPTKAPSVWAWARTLGWLPPWLKNKVDEQQEAILDNGWGS